MTTWPRKSSAIFLSLLLIAQMILPALAQMSAPAPVQNTSFAPAHKLAGTNSGGDSDGDISAATFRGPIGVAVDVSAQGAYSLPILSITRSN